MVFSVAAVLAISALCASVAGAVPEGALAAAAVQPPVLVPVRADVPTNSTAALRAKQSILTGAGGKGFDGYLEVFSAAAPSFSVQAPPGCHGRVNTTVQAASHGCQFATNGGPFDMSNGDCSGTVITDGKRITGSFAPSEIHFALTASGDWLLGHVSKAQATSLEVEQLVTGFNWLVYDGKSTQSTPGGEVAPRTAVAIDKDGRMMLLVVDGCEKCTPAGGLTMKGLADMMAAAPINAVHAINLDGGGSTTLVANGKLADFPTCIDTLLKCERAVATIMCLK